MRIAYCTNTRLPSERAHAHQIFQVCGALSRLGHAVRLFAPYRRRLLAEEPYYNMDVDIEPEYLGRFDFISSPLLPGFLGLALTNWRLRYHYRYSVRAEDFDLFYTRVPALVPALAGRGVPAVLELHDIPRLGRSELIDASTQLDRIFCLTEAMRGELMELGVSEGKLAVEGDAVDLRRFDPMPSRTDSRKEFGLRTERPVLGYVGRLTTLGMEKGVGDLMRAVAQLRDSQPVFALIVGGPEEEARRYRAQARRLGLGEADVRILGPIPAKRVPTALACADVLAMPWPDLLHYRRYMSPLKMFEYMASSRPIITSDLPSIRDVLSEDSAVFCRPGDPVSLADAVRWVVEHKDEAEVRAATARRLVETFTWERRMERILQTLDS